MNSKNTRSIVLPTLMMLIGILLSCAISSPTVGGDTSTSAALVSTQSATKSPAPRPPTTSGATTAVTCTHYVAPGGGDDDPGTQAQPWATFQHAADTAQPGDTVCFRGGTYPTEEIHLTRSGTSSASITFIAYPGEAPILDGGGTAGGLLILDQYTSYVRISGFALRNFTIWGMELSGENRYVYLDHLDIEGGEASIHFTYGETEAPPAEGPVEHITLEDSTIHGSQYSAVDCTPGPCNHMVIRRTEIYSTGLVGEAFYGSDGLEFARGYPVLVEDCYVHDNGGDGIDLNSRDRAGNASGVIVRRNRVVRNHLNGIKLWAGGRMENNVVWGQGNSAVWVGTFTSTLEVYNNTIAYDMWDPTYSERNWVFVAGYPEEVLPYPPVTLTLVNNVFAFNADPTEGGPTGIYLGGGVQLTEHHNLYYSREDGEITAEFVSGHDPNFTRAEIADGTWTTYTGQGQNDLTTDPLFVSGWSGVDVHLQENSPAIDAGSVTGAPTDDAEGRPRDAQPDLGAYEQWEPTAWLYLPLILRRSEQGMSWWQPAVGATWQWQLTDLPIDTAPDVDVYDVDLFDNDASTVAALHAQGCRVFCYVSVGSWEDWCPDADQFPATVLGNEYEGWPGEKWLDVRQIDVLAPIMRARFDQCQAKGFDGIEPDNVDGYTNDTGFPLTYQDQIAYNTWLAGEAHARGLSIGLKNDDGQVNDLLPYFDWAMTEDCFADEWCSEVTPFITEGKVVFAAEHTDQFTTAQFLDQVCPQAGTSNFSAILKNRDLDAWRQACP